MSNQPKYIEFSYDSNLTLDLDKLKIDLATVQSWHIKWHELRVTFLDESEEEFNLDEYGCDIASDFDTKRPFQIEIFDKDWQPTQLGK